MFSIFFSACSLMSTVVGSETRLKVNRGCLVYTTSNGHLPVDRFFIFFNANSAWARAKSHFDLVPLRQRIRLPSVLLVSSVYPSVYGCVVILYFKVVSNFFHRVLQKWLRNFTSRSDTIVLGTPCRRTTSLRKRLAM